MLKQSHIKNTKLYYRDYYYDCYEIGATLVMVYKLLNDLTLTANEWINFYFFVAPFIGEVLAKLWTLHLRTIQTQLNSYFSSFSLHLRV